MPPERLLLGFLQAFREQRVPLPPLAQRAPPDPAHGRSPVQPDARPDQRQNADLHRVRQQPRPIGTAPLLHIGTTPFRHTETPR